MTVSANKSINKHNAGANMSMAGVIASRPAYGYEGRYYYATDTGITYRDSGTAWVQVSPSAISPFSLGLSLAHGQLLNIGALEESTVIAAAATSSSVIQIPAGAVVLAVPTYVVVAPPGTSTMTVGVSGTATKFNTGSTIPSTLAAADVGTKAGPSYFAAATSILITPNTTPSDATGRVRTTIIYYTATAPTS